MRVRTRGRVESRKGRRMRNGYSPSEHATNQLHIWTRASFYPITLTVAMAEKGDDGGRKEPGKQSDPLDNSKEGDSGVIAPTARSYRDSRESRETQARVSRSHTTKRPLHPDRCETQYVPA